MLCMIPFTSAVIFFFDLHERANMISAFLRGIAIAMTSIQNQSRETCLQNLSEESTVVVTSLHLTVVAPNALSRTVFR